MKKAIVLLFVFCLVSPFGLTFGQTHPKEFGSNENQKLRSSKSLDFKTGKIIPDLNHIRIDGIDNQNIFPKGIEVDPELKLKGFLPENYSGYSMPILEPEGNYTMKYFKPDSTIHHTLLIKELGGKLEGFEK